MLTAWVSCGLPAFSDVHHTVHAGRFQVKLCQVAGSAPSLHPGAILHP